MLTNLLAGQLTWNIPLLAGAISISILYFILVKKYAPSPKILKPILFLTGIWLLYALIGSPLLAITHLSFSFHMTQMSFLFFIIPPLILLGIPKGLYDKAKTTPLLQKLAVLIPSPKIALLTFAALLFVYHIPFVLDVITNHPAGQKTYLTVLVLLGFRMYWPIASPEPQERVISDKRRKYLLASSVFIMPACALFIVSGLLESAGGPALGGASANLCLPAGSDLQVLPPPFNTKYDQMLASCFMMGLHKMGTSVTCRLERKC